MKIRPKTKLILEKQMELFEIERPRFLSICRSIARQFCRDNGWVSADEVREIFESRFPGVRWPEKAAGAIFRDGNFKVVDVKISSQNSRRGGLVRIWKLKEER